MRQPGFYKVKFGEKWEVAKYAGYCLGFSDAQKLLNHEIIELTFNGDKNKN